MTLRVAIYVFPNVEVLDFAGPFEVFTTASRVHTREKPADAAPFEVYTVARSASAIQTRAGLRMLPDYAMAACPAADILIVPGGVVDDEVRDAQLIDWVIERSKSAAVVASVCTGAFIVAKAGLLDHRKATTHWEDLADLRATFPAVEVIDGKRWVDEGSVVSSAGIAAGMDMSLYLVARFAGEALAKAAARQLDVPYTSEP